MTMTLTSHGAARTVTGSRHLLESEGKRLLIDCGLFQGLKELRLRNWAPFPVPPDSLDAVVLTHAHLDHSGYLPRLMHEGYRGDIVCTEATADLCEILLRDSAQLQERDAEYANRRGFSKHHPAMPLYRIADAERALKHMRTMPIHQPIDLPGGGVLQYRRAGHILGAATAEIRWRDRCVVFSGDLGRYDDAVMLDPEPVTEADYLVVESTYGDRVHPPYDPTEALGEIIERTVQRGGTVLIPSFAVGRAQSLLYHLWRLRQMGRLPLVPIFLDSPMAIDATELQQRHLSETRLSAEENRAACEVATYVRDVEASKAITASPVPKIILSASGMVTGGRILHHIRAFGGDRRNTILLSGFQAPGTRGAQIQAGASEVKIHGRWWPIRAEVASLEMLSAHADSDQIMRWLGGFKRPPKQTFVVHGEAAAAEALRLRIADKLGWNCTVSEPGVSYRLK